MFWIVVCTLLTKINIFILLSIDKEKRIVYNEDVPEKQYD